MTSIPQMTEICGSGGRAANVICLAEAFSVLCCSVFVSKLGHCGLRVRAGQASK